MRNRIEIVHRLPGRIRMRIDRSPRDINTFISSIKDCEGVEMVSFNTHTRSLLVYYYPSVISYVEIIVRVGIELSMSYNGDSISITNAHGERSLHSIDYYAAASLLTALIGKGITNVATTQTYLDYHAGIATSVAVFKHAWREIKRNGIYDPEVISIVYLLSALLRGNVLTASVITWVATFGRHLAHLEREVCLLDATEVMDEAGLRYVDVTIRSDLGHPASQPFKALVFWLGRMVGLKSGDQQGLMEQIKLMSKKHGNVLEGVGAVPAPVYMRLPKVVND